MLIAKTFILAVSFVAMLPLPKKYFPSSWEGYYQVAPTVVAQAQTEKPKEVKKEGGKVVSSNPYSEIGEATWYDYIALLKKGGKDTSKLDPERLTAAHKTLPFGSVVLVEPLNQSGYQPIEVVINDRLPQASTRTIDLHKASAIAMSPAFIKRGVIKVKITRVR